MHATVIEPKTLRKGSTGNEVYYLQTLLNRFFGAVLSVDGFFGTHTEFVVEDFQAACAITVDGIVGSATWAYLEQVDALSMAPKHILSQGSAGNEVKYLQIRLNSYYADTLAVDGDFGSQTMGLVKQFQMDRHLTVDGIVGSRTWEFLEKPDWDR